MAKALKKILLIGTCFACSGLLFGQRLSTDEREIVEEARASFEIGDYLTVRKLLEPHVTDFNADPELMYFYGGASFYLREFHTEAFPFLRVAYELGESRALYIYITSLLERYRIAEAQDLIENSGALDLPEGRELYAQVQVAKRAMANPVPSVVEPMAPVINTPYTEHSPLIAGNDSTLYFTSRKPIDKNAITDMLGRYDENIYRSVRTKDGWSVAEPLEGEINDILNDAAVALLGDEERMVIFKTARDMESSDLWLYGVNRNGKWKKEMKLSPSINSKWIENGLTVNANGDLFIVASDRPGGYGGMDLYRIVRFGNGEYSEPLNLGPLVNTEYDEIAPTLLLDDRTMFFSRNGVESMGGFDVFRTNYLGDTTFTDVVNLGYPINSTRDDLHISVSPLTRRAYLTRSKEDQPADFDIYSANLPGFNLRATVYKFKLTAGSAFDLTNAEVSLFTADFSEIQGMYTVNELGEFIVVLLPGESGVLGIDLPGAHSEEIELFYQDSETIIEKFKTITLSPNEP
ncbi:MAG: PD40 domain-containing protein [Flavobacteriales bacterium]|nr:PD40 domain-containing protein [Flavobacteriales bacterium]